MGTETIPFEIAVAKGAILVATKEAADNINKLELGEIADRVEPKYQQETHNKLAELIKIKPRTLDRYLTTYRAWPDFRALGRVKYSVLRALAPLDDRYEILAANPDMTKEQAEQITADRKPIKAAPIPTTSEASPEPNDDESDDPEADQPPGAPSDLENIRRGWSNFLEASATVGGWLVTDVTEQQEALLRQVVPPVMLTKVRQRLQRGLNTVSLLENLFELEPAE
jgi:hypothetical protein